MTPHYFILGPTGSGKSAAALALATQIGGWVCNLDAFQIYRGLDIGTGKPTAADQARVPHRLYDLVGPLGVFTAGDFLREATALKNNHPNQPMVWVGGTGLYYRILRTGLASTPASDPSVLLTLESLSLEARVAEIRKVDPEWSTSADLSNQRRVIRALAVFRQTGRKMSSWHEDPVVPLIPHAVAVQLVHSPDVLRSRIAHRVESMWAAGWPDEVRGLSADPVWKASPSARALGYLAILNLLEAGGDSVKVRQTIVTETWHYSRRQLTWLRREPKVTVITVDEQFDPETLARSIVRDVPPAYAPCS